MSTFVIGSDTATFSILEDGFSTGGGVAEELRVTVSLASAAAWGTFFSLRSWGVSVEAIPGGSDGVVNYEGGAGEGTLTVTEADLGAAKTALLSDPRLTTIGADGKRLATATFTITGLASP